MYYSAYIRCSRVSFGAIKNVSLVRIIKYYNAVLIVAMYLRDRCCLIQETVRSESDNKCFSFSINIQGE